MPARVPGEGTTSDYLVEAPVGHTPSALTWGELASLSASKEEEEEPSNSQDWVASLAANGQEQVRRNLEGPEGRCQ